MEGGLDLVEQAIKLYDDCVETLARKNHDYAGTLDPWKNLTLVERMGICSTEIGILCRLTDKFSRIQTLLIQESSPQIDESLRDTIMDMCNYLVLLHLYVETKRCR